MAKSKFEKVNGLRFLFKLQVDCCGSALVLAREMVLGDAIELVYAYCMPFDAHRKEFSLSLDSWSPQYFPSREAGEYNS